MPNKLSNHNQAVGANLLIVQAKYATNAEI
jgi:hypothetical protein